MDGVITGESCYWDAAALVVWELFYAPGYMGLPASRNLPSFTPAPGVGDVSTIRKVVFEDDAVISFFKRRALNSNWDLAFLTFAYQLVGLLRAFSQAGPGRINLPQAPGEGLALEHLKHYGFLLQSMESLHWEPFFPDLISGWAGEARGLELMDRLAQMVPYRYGDMVAETFALNSRLWKGVKRVFQEWYFGDEQFGFLYGERPAHFGKEGLIYREKPVLPQEIVRETLEELRNQGWNLGIATGRPYNELYPPLEKMNLWDFFDESSVVTFTDVEQVENRLKDPESPDEELSLGKPHPFSFLKAYWSGSYSERELASPHFPRPPENDCWVVGDSMADLIAAKKMGAGFIGVLTGHNGPSNEPLFLREGARAVFPDITHLPRFFTSGSR